MSTQINRSAVAAGLQRAQPNIGSVPGIKVPTGTSDHRQMDERTVVIPAGTPLPVAIEGDYIIIQGSDFPFSNPIGSRPLVIPGTSGFTDGILTVRTDNNDFIRLDSIGKGFTFPRPFKQLFFLFTPNFQVAGATLAQISIRFYAGYGRMQNDSGVNVALGLQGSSVISWARPNNAGAAAVGQIIAPVPALPILPNLTRFPGMGGIITRATLSLGSANTVNANFSLWLFQIGAGVPAFSDGTLITAIALPMSGFQGIINFPTCIQAGNSSAVCDVSGINVPFLTDFTASAIPPVALMNTQFQGGGGLLGILACNAAYNVTAFENIQIQLFTDQY